MIKSALFRIRNQKAFALLQGRVEVCRLGRRTPTDFYCLGRGMEEYRDLIRDHLDTLPTAERSAAEDQLWPAILTLYDLVDRLVEEAQKAGVIDEAMAYDLGMLGISLMFVASFSKHVF